MKAPDKIYIPQHNIEAGTIQELCELIVEGSVEYIRKNALLEWLKEQKKDCERIIREHPEDESLWCERDRYDELIDKINSL